jgi:hypothetical protein
MMFGIGSGEDGVSLRHETSALTPVGWSTILGVRPLALVIAIIIAVFAVLVFVVTRFSNPKIRGPALTGTAQILSVQPTTGPVRQGGGLPLRIGLSLMLQAGRTQRLTPLLARTS